MKNTLRYLSLLAATFASLTTIAADAPPKQTKAEQIMLPKLAINKARVHEAVKFLARKSRDLDPAKTGIAIVFAAPADDETRVSLDLANVSIDAAVKKIAEAANLEMRVDGDNITLKPKLTTATPPPAAPSQPIPGLKPIPK